MTQRDATNILFDLAPKLAKEDPASVLSKYARDMNLAPAQLQRLGNVFNTLSVLVQQDKDKTAAPFLLDVPEMVSGFVKNLKAKEATSIFDEPQEVSTPAPAADKQASTSVEFSWLEECKPAVEKVASAPASKPNPRAELETGIFVTKEALTHLEELLPAASSALNKVAASLVADQNPSEAFSTLMRDYELIHNTDTLDLEHKLAAACAAKGVEVKRHKLHAPIVVRDHTGHIADTIKAASVLIEVDTTWEVIEKGASLVLSRKAEFEFDLILQRGVEQITKELSKAASRSNLFKSSYAQAVDEEETKKKERSQNRNGGLAESFATNADRAIAEKDPLGTLLNTSGLVGARGTDLMINGVGRGVGSLPGIWNEFTTEGQLGKGLDALVGEDNRQKAVNDSLDLNQIKRDAEAMALFQKVIMTDEVLSKKDPEKVFEAWKSIRNASPEVASDTTILRLMLRSALETQGVDIDSASAARKFEQGSYKGELQPFNQR